MVIKKMRTVAFIISAYMSVTISLVACSGQGGSPSGAVENDAPSAPLTVEPSSVVDYEVSGNVLTVRNPAETLHECAGTAGRTLSVPASDEVSDFRIEGRTLTLEARQPIRYGSGNARYRITSILERIGDGDGLEGNWRYRETRYKLAEGAPSREETEAVDRLHRYLDWMDAKHLVTDVEFRQGRASTRYQGTGGPLFMAHWNGQTPMENGRGILPSSDFYDISVTLEPDGVVRLQGRKNGETVRRTFNSVSRVESFSSSDPAHKPYSTEDRHPLDCSDGSNREWFQAFKQANQKTL